MINDDCIKALEYLVQEKIKVDLILTDPPYAVTEQEWDKPLNYPAIWSLLNQLVKNDNTPILLFSNGKFTYDLISTNPKNFKYSLYWNKYKGSNAFLAKYRPMTVIENINVFTRKGKRANYYPQLTKRDKPITRSHGNNGNCFFHTKNIDSYYHKKRIYTHSHPVDLLNFKRSEAERKIHPNCKPQNLLEWLIKSYSLENEVILDFTAGSGSTGVASLNLNRRFIGIERDNNYFDIMNQRISNTQNKEGDSNS